MSDDLSAPLPANDSLTLVAFSDIHVWRFGWDWDFTPKCLLGLTNLALRRARHYPISAQMAMIERLATEQADHLLFAGDLTTTSLRAEFEDGQMLLAPLLLRWEGRFLAIPGNHDRYTPRAARQQLFEKLFLGKEQSYPFTTRLGEHWSLVAIDCSVPRYFSSRGHVSEETLKKIDDELAREQAAGRKIIVMGHYPLAYPRRIRPTWEHVLPERDQLLGILERRGVQLYVHGHKHHSWLTQTGAIRHANCGSAGLDVRGRRPGYLRLRLEGPAIASIEAVSMAPSWTPAHPSPDAWLRVEMTPEPARD